MAVDDQRASERGTSEVELGTRVPVSYRRIDYDRAAFTRCVGLKRNTQMPASRTVFFSSSRASSSRTRARRISSRSRGWWVSGALMLKVEAEFDLSLPQPEITPENFQSVKALELMILNQLEPGAG